VAARGLLLPGANVSPSDRQYRYDYNDGYYIPPDTKYVISETFFAGTEKVSAMALYSKTKTYVAF